MITLLAKLLKVLNAEAEPGQISAAFCLAMIIGFTPVFALHNIVVVFAALVFRGRRCCSFSV